MNLKSLFGKLTGTNLDPNDSESAVEQKISIYNFLEQYYEPQPELTAFLLLRQLIETNANAIETAAAIDALKPFYQKPAPALPDDAEYETGKTFRWAAGGEDGQSWFRVMPNEDEAEQYAARTFKLLLEMLAATSPHATARKLDELALLNKVESDDNGNKFVYRQSVISWAFPLMRKILEWSQAQDEQIVQSFYELARHLAFNSADRVPTKIGLLMLGATNAKKSAEDLDKALILGRHEEFAWYAARLFFQSLQNPTAQIWELAFANSGWGRIMSLHVLFSILRETDAPVPPPLQWWLLRAGYANEVLPQYTAINIVELADLRGELATGQVTDELLRGAEVMLRAIVEGGPINVDLTEWREAPECFALYRQRVSESSNPTAYATDFLPS